MFNSIRRISYGGARFVRLNPDRAYIEQILNKSAPNAVDNDAFIPFDHISIRNAVEPGSFESELGRETIVPAGACELADRTFTNNLAPQLDDVITEVTTVNNMPVGFRLEQNYPNPFNAGTIIQFSIPKSCHVVLDVYDLLGRKIARLVDGNFQHGQHKVKFDESSLSGIYFYKIRAGEFQAARKMVILE